MRPGKPYPATFRLSVDPPGIEPGLPACRAGVFPLDHEPISGPPGSRTPIAWVQTKRPTIERAALYHSEVRPGIEPGLPPYHSGVPPKHLQTDSVSLYRLRRWTTGSLVVILSTMKSSNEIVPESSIDYDEVFRRGGANCGDEDFALCKCPDCESIYLIEYEVDTIYTSAENLSQREHINIRMSSFVCKSCSLSWSPGPWIGPDAPATMCVSWNDLASSPWYWITRITRERSL